VAGRDIWRAEDKFCHTHEAYQRARQALEYLEAAMRSWTSIGPSSLKIWPSVEMWLKSKGWGRGMYSGMVWHIGTTNYDQGMSGWMSVSDEAGSPLVLFTTLQVYRVNWLRAKAQMDRWQEEVTLVQNETR